MGPRQIVRGTAATQHHQIALFAWHAAAHEHSPTQCPRIAACGSGGHVLQPKRRGFAADLLQVQQRAITDAIQDCS
jgi:hypothetical protein